MHRAPSARPVRSLPLAAALLFAAVALSATAAPRAADWSYRVVEGEGGVPLNVATAGDPSRPALLLVHGIGQSHLSFEHQLRAPVTDQFFVVSFDLRGHGNSGKPMEPAAYKDPKLWAGDVRRIMDALGLQRVVLLGWSYGTLIVSDYLRQYGSERLDGIVLVGAYGGLTPPPTPPPAAAAEGMARNRALQLSANPEDNFAAARATAGMLTARDMGQAWRDRAVAIAMMLPGASRKAMFERALANMDQIPRITVPILINVGGKDGSTQEPFARELAQKITAQGGRALVSVYPEAGHSPFAEEPERFNRELMDFARSVQPAAPTAPKKPAARVAQPASVL